MEPLPRADNRSAGTLDRANAAIAVAALRADLGAWRSEATSTPSMPDDLAVMIESIHDAFATVVSWIQLSPIPCVERGQPVGDTRG